MADLDTVLANFEAAKAALEDLETALLDRLVAAKTAHSVAPTEATRAAKAAAVDDVQRFRAATRAGRPQGTGGLISGDVFVSTPDRAEG